MQKDREKKVRGIEEALKTAHRKRDLRGPGDAFAAGVMREIRQAERSGVERTANGRTSRQDVAPMFEFQTVWRFAAATSLLALLFFGHFLGTDPTGAVQYELAESAAGDTSDLILADSLAVI
ncbi:MAG: hypothetical protein WAW37_17165 [Syntrophobacteraceae bacterium]